MSKVIHHIHPHVMGTNDHRGDRDSGHNNFFKHFGHGFNRNDNNNGVHSFSATYSNVNGHVKRHFSKNGHSVDPHNAMDQMKKMDEEMSRSFHQMDKAFGGLDNAFGGNFLGNDRSDDRKSHPFRRLFGDHHRNRRGNLTGRIKRRK